MYTWVKCCILALLTVLQVCNAQEVVYRGLGEYRDSYHTELLQAILDSAKPGQFTARSYPLSIPHQRAFELLVTRTDLDIMIGYATQERLDSYHAIQIPIMKGLSGWRVALVHENNINRFQNISNLEQLRAFKPGMFHTWTDNKIFEHNGIEPVKGAHFVGLFRMLHKQRFDYFPMSILEAAREAETFKKEYKLAIAVDPHILITYPVCFYFYVDKTNKDLAKVLNIGFEKIISSGQFEQIFSKHHNHLLQKFLTGNRKIVRLANPLLPVSVPLDRPELWVHYQYSDSRPTTLY
ncbi:ABC transporter substrate-binding protein [Catenovulum agarivorans]|uniref:ABC transporter substrate-binding protein n=1 Tax=Catenovulum agarivorans TaxID=1172192 RepID=UPI0002D8C4FD|nr:ABC transporter substrate-binding protein [Catenovulum agarivorans]